MSIMFRFSRQPSLGLRPRLMVAFLIVSMLAPVLPATGEAQDAAGPVATPVAEDGSEPSDDQAGPVDPGDRVPGPHVDEETVPPSADPEEGNDPGLADGDVSDEPAPGEQETIGELPDQTVEPASTTESAPSVGEDDREEPAGIVLFPDDAEDAVVGTPEPSSTMRTSASTMDLLQGSVHITNYDQTRTPLEGVQFEVLQDGVVLATKSTTNTGVLTIHELPTDVDFVAHQITTPAGCDPVPDQSFRVDGGGPFQARLIFVNACDGGEAGSISVTVRDQAGTPLDNVEASAHYFDGVNHTNFLPVTTDSSGRASIAPVYVGFDYEVRLRSLPAGCMTPVPQSVSVTPALPHPTLEFVSQCSDPALTGARLNIVKHDHNNVDMAGIDFEIWQGSTLVTTGTTNHMGQIGIENPPAGTLILRETNTPPGCIDSGDTSVDIPVGGTIAIRIENDCSGSSGEITVRVVDQYGTTLPGVTFRVETGSRIHGRWTTGSVGEATVAPLTLNQTYEIIHETGGCAGWGTELAYLDEADPRMTVIVESYCSDAEPPPAHLLLVKTDETGTLLPGADFELSLDGTLVAIGTTDANGEILFAGLVPGEEYDLRETAAPEGCTPGEDQVIRMPDDGSDQTTKPVNACAGGEEHTPTPTTTATSTSTATSTPATTPTMTPTIVPDVPAGTPDAGSSTDDDGQDIGTPWGENSSGNEGEAEDNSSNPADAEGSTEIRGLPSAGSEPVTAQAPLAGIVLGALAVCLAGMGTYVVRRR